MRARHLLFATVLVVGLVAGAASGPAAAARATSGKSPAVEAEVERTSTGFTISWAPSARVKAVRWGDDPDHVGEVLVASVPKGAHEVTVEDPSPGTRPYFALDTGKGTPTVVAERKIPLEGDPNFRDVGGYGTVDGRTVKWGRIYRSGELSELTDADLATVDALGIKLVCDLRSPTETAAAPDRAPTGSETLALPIFDESVDPQAVRDAVIAGDVSGLGKPGELLTDGGRAFVKENTDEYRKMMERLTDQRYRPALVHCTAGKDRAGLGAAIVLLTLGVPEKTVMDDYLLSNTYRAAENEEAIAQIGTLLDPDEIEVVQALLDVRPEYLQASIDQMKQQYGSIDKYLRRGLGISDAERKRFQDQMLEG